MAEAATPERKNIMSQPTGQDFAQVKTKISEIAARAKANPTYLQELRANPRQTLLAAGLPDGAVDDVLREEGVGDVQGYMKCWLTCMTTNGCSLTVST
jgi:hypothetical protein